MTREHNAGVLRLIAEDAGPGVVGVARPVTTTLRGPWRDVARLGIAKRAVRLEGFEPPPTQIRSLRLYPLSYRRTLRRDSRHREFPRTLCHRQPAGATVRPDRQSRFPMDTASPT